MRSTFDLMRTTSSLLRIVVQVSLETCVCFASCRTVPYTGSFGVVSNPVVAYSNVSANVTIIQVFAQDAKGQVGVVFLTSS